MERELEKIQKNQKNRNRERQRERERERENMRVSQISKFFKIVVLALCMMMNVRIGSAAEECSQICIAETKKGERPEKLDVDKACKPTEDLKAWCNVGCMCQAMSAAMRSSPPYFGFLANHPVAPLVGGGVVSEALQPASCGASRDA